MTRPNDIQTEIAALPPNLRAEVLDFVQFLKQRHGLPATPALAVADADTGDSAFFQALCYLAPLWCHLNRGLMEPLKSRANGTTRIAA